MLTIAEQQDWRLVMRVGVLPFASTAGLRSLALALRTDDPRLVRGLNFEPLWLYPDMPCVAACPLCWLVWQGREGVAVGEVDRGWQELLRQCREATGSSLAPQSVIDAVDGIHGAPLSWGELLGEVEGELSRREGGKR